MCLSYVVIGESNEVSCSCAVLFLDFPFLRLLLTRVNISDFSFDTHHSPPLSPLKDELKHFIR